MQNTTKKDNWLNEATKDDYEYRKVLYALGKVSKMIYLSIDYATEDEIFYELQSELAKRRFGYMVFQPRWSTALKRAMNFVIKNHRDNLTEVNGFWPFRMTAWSTRYKAEAMKAIRNLSFQLAG